MNQAQAPDFKKTTQPLKPENQESFPEDPRNLIPSLCAGKIPRKIILVQGKRGNTERQALRKGRQMVAGQPEIGFIDRPNGGDMHQKRRTPISIPYIILTGNKYTLEVVFVGS